MEKQAVDVILIIVQLMEILIMDVVVFWEIMIIVVSVVINVLKKQDVLEQVIPVFVIVLPMINAPLNLILI